MPTPAPFRAAYFMINNQQDTSVQLFFQTFSNHLKRIRDEGKDANQAYRAQILLGQLQQFEKAIFEYRGAVSSGADGDRIVRKLFSSIDLAGLVHWMEEARDLVHVAAVFYLNSLGEWTRLHGDEPLPEKMRVREWLERGLLGRLSEETLDYLFFVNGQPRLILRFESLGENDDLRMPFLRFLARQLPLFITTEVVQHRHEAVDIRDMVACDPLILELLTLIGRVAAKDVTVLLEGESGTGKEVIANYICRKSGRAKKPFVPVNCAAIPAGLMESELFGHEKGAFTGAHQRSIGYLEKAQGGTLFLDEIGEIDLAMQAKLLRFIQLGELHRVGGRQKISVDVRIVAATNRDLKQRVKEGMFREDLYYRLSVAPFTVPPLRERVNDIYPLTRYFLEKYAGNYQVPVPEVDGLVYQTLAAYEFPGNVRELENIVQNMLAINQGELITAAHLPAGLQQLEPVARPVVDQSGKPRIWRKRKSYGHRVDLNLFRSASVPSVEITGAEQSWQQATPHDNDELKRAKQEIKDYASHQTLDLERRFLKELMEQADGSMPMASKISKINRTLLYKMLERTKK